MATKAIYPGSFDPFTYGHLDIVTRGLKAFDTLIVAVLRHPGKGRPLFSPTERMEMIREATGFDPRVEVDTFEGLLVDYARRKGAHIILRGLRAVSDFEYEMQMAHMNRRLLRELETYFLMTDDEYSFLSSRLVKEVFCLGGSVEGMVPECVLRRLEHYADSRRDQMISGILNPPD